MASMIQITRNLVGCSEKTGPRKKSLPRAREMGGIKGEEKRFRTKKEREGGDGKGIETL